MCATRSTEERAGFKPLSPEDRTTEEEFKRVWQVPSGLWGRLITVQNSPIGMRIVLTAFTFFLLAGVTALLIRIQLAWPNNQFVGPQRYNELFTMHGSTMMYLFAVPFLEGAATLILPQLLGARDLPFPRMTAFAFWTFLFGGLMFYASWFYGAAPDGGWFAYPPLTGPIHSPDLAIDFWLLGLSVAEIGAIAGAIELIISVLKMRAPGMSLSRMPIFAWAVLVMAFSMIFAFTPLIVGTLFLELDRKIGTHFFNPDGGGSPLLWQHIFWIFGHPDVYIQFIPAAGIISTVIPVFARQRLAGYSFVVISILTTGFISFGLWVHHMFTTGLPELGLFFFTAASMMIAIPSGIQVFSWLGTIWNGRPVWRTSFLFAVGFLVIFILGGVTGVMVASVPFDWQTHDTYFVVAHFHYVLVGGVLFPIFAGIYFWFPKFTGLLLSERLGRWNFWLLFIGFNLAFFPLHIVGLIGMPRRVYTYHAGLGWTPYNMVSTIGAFILGLGVLVFLWNVLYTVRRGDKAGPDPWGADTLEWSTTSPTPPEGFRFFPVVRGRHPLWDQEHLDPVEEKTRSLVRDLGDWPIKWRAQIVTSVVDGRPEEIFRVAGPSIWPVVTSAGLTSTFVGFLFDQYLVVGLGYLVVIVAAIIWNWPHPIEDEETARAFEKEHGIPVGEYGSLAVARWGMGLGTLVAAIAVATAIFSYLYLRLDNVQWPPPGMPLPSLVLPAVQTGLILLAILALYLARRWERAEQMARFKGGLAASFLLGAAFLGVHIYESTQLPFSPQTNAYGSAFWVTILMMGVLVAGGLIMSAVTQFWAWWGYYRRGGHVAIQNLSLFWYFLAVAWLAVFGTLHLSPYLI